MPRSQASSWAPVGTAGAKLGDICSDEFFQKLIADHLGTHSAARTAEIRKRLEHILGSLRLWLHYRERPTGGSKIAALRKAQKALKAVSDVLRTLDAESRRMIEQASEDDAEFEGRIEPDRYPVPINGKVRLVIDRHGDDHVIEAVARIEALARWVKAAQKACRRSSSGKTPEPDELRAVKRLKELWRETRVDTKKDPSELELRKFATAALKPIRNLYDATGSMAGHVHGALYGTRAELAAPRKSKDSIK
jgi:hypothetical protein